MGKIEIGQDKIKLTLTFHQRQMLSFVASRGGRVEYKYGTKPLAQHQENLPPQVIERMQKIAIGADDGVRKMSTELGVLREVPIIGRGADVVWLELTDIGRNVIEQMKLRVEGKT